MIKKATRITRESSTLIDLIATNNPSTISKYGVGCTRKLHHVKYSPKVIICRNYSAYDPNAMNEDFKNVNWQPIYDTSNVNVALTYFNKTVKAIFDHHAPQIIKKVRGKPCPWLNSDIRKSMISRDRMLRKARRTKKEEHWNLYRKLRNTCNNKLRYAKSTFQKELVEENATNPRKFWNIIKDIFPNKTKGMPTSKDQEQNHNQLTIFSKYFANAVRCLKEN